VVLQNHAKITIASQVIYLFTVYTNQYIMCLKCKDTFKINVLVFVLFIRQHKKLVFTEQNLRAVTERRFQNF